MGLLPAYPLIPPLIAFAISFFTSMGGVSGAFLLLPLQVTVMGITAPSVSATTELYNVLAIPGGVWRYIKERRMLWPLAWVMLAGTVPGTLAGAIIRIQYLPDPKKFKLFAGLVLLFIGATLFRELFNTHRSMEPAASQELPFKDPADQAAFVTAVREFSFRNVSYTFSGADHAVSVWKLWITSGVVGIAGGIYGIGGGAILSPILVAVFGLPVYTVAGACLLNTFVASTAGVLFYEALARFHVGARIAPDWRLGLLLGVGGFAGIYCGARVQKHVPARFIKMVLVFCTFFLSCKYVWDFVRSLR